MNQKELKELIEFLIEKDIAEFELERGDVKVRIKRGSEAVVIGAGRALLYRACGTAAGPGAGAAPLAHRVRLPPAAPVKRRPRPRKGCTLSALPSWARSTSRPLPDLHLL